MNKFSKLGLSPNLVTVLDQMGFENPTPVQEKSIPLLLEEDPCDFIGLAQTGTGKTAAFGLPLIDLIEEDFFSTQALIMAPTRELAQQTAKQLKDFSKAYKSINVEVVYGGAAIQNQIKALKRATQIVVATPGRLLDLIKRKAISLDDVQYVVLDEADEMLNMGFQEDIDEILSYTLEDRVTWLFSATMPAEIRRLTAKYMQEPLEVQVNAEQKSNLDISHKYVVTKTANKIAALRRFLDQQPEMRGVMFCRTRLQTQQIADELGELGYGAEALHGDMSQSQRDKVMKRYKTRSMQLLVATDVAARGIDVSNLSHVIHHTLPDQLEVYTHRSGRTGRAGKKGISLVFSNPREGRRIQELEKKLKIKFERIDVPGVDELKSARINNWADLIVNTQVDNKAHDILNELRGQFAHLSKDDILKRLITTQLDHLMVQTGEPSDLNEHSERKRENRGKGGYRRYFVNIGSIDGLTKADLIHFLSDISGIDRKLFGELTIQKTCAYFDVDENSDKGLTQKFEGIEIEGRSIRVNPDDEGSSKSRRSSSPKKQGKRFSSRRSKRPAGRRKRR